MLIVKLPLNNKNATAYIRVSSQQQVDKGVSIDAQKRRIKEYAKFKGLNLDGKDIFVEEGVSGGIPIWERCIPVSPFSIRSNRCFAFWPSPFDNIFCRIVSLRHTQRRPARGDELSGDCASPIGTRTKLFNPRCEIQLV